MSVPPVLDSNESRQPLPPPSSELMRSQYSRGVRLVARGIWKIVPYIPALVPGAIVLGIVLTLISASGFHNFGLGFFGSAWVPDSDQYGVLIFVVGSFVTAVPALFIAMAIGLGIAIASTTYLPQFVSRLLDPFVDLLAGIPSIVYGLWGFWVVSTFFGQSLNPWLADHIGFVPGFGRITSPVLSPNVQGIGLPISIFILTLMCLPITTLLMRDALRSVPRDLWESGLALGATRWEVVRRVAIPYSNRGILSAGLLGFGRAFGETVAVAMVIGSVLKYPGNVYDTTSTMAAFMIQQLDASFQYPVILNALAEMALLLLAISLVVNILGRRLVTRTFFEEVPGL
ncbi:MAG: phosphate ABC transporter permease subunit PstC [Thermoplasmata archaeon]